jgi:hypothetical protein
MKLEINHGEIIGIKDQILNPILPTEDLSFIEDKDLYKEIRNYIKNDHPNLENKLIFDESEKVMKYSNLYLAVAVDMFSKEYHPEYRLATQFDLEQNLPMFEDFDIDSGLALRNLTGTNKDKGIYLFNQLKQRGIKKSNFPIWVDLRGITLDSNLNFNLTDESRYKLNADCLNWKKGEKYSLIDDYGLPKKKDSNSGRQIWTADHALSGGSLSWCSVLVSGNSVFVYSGDNGRVVVAKVRST